MDFEILKSQSITKWFHCTNKCWEVYQSLSFENIACNTTDWNAAALESRLLLPSESQSDVFSATNS